MATSSSTPAAASAPTPAPAKPKVVRPVPSAKAAKQPLAASTYIAVVACITALIVIVCLFVGYRLLGRIFLDIKVISKEAQAKSALSTKLNDAGTLVTNYNNLGSNKQQLIADALPTDTDFNQLVALMGSLASSSGIQLKSITPATAAGSTAAATTSGAAAAPTNTAATPFSYDVTVEGQYSQLVAYFHNLELSARPMRVVTATFTGSSSDIISNLQIQTYYQAKATVNDQQVTVK